MKRHTKNIAVILIESYMREIERDWERAAHYFPCSMNAPLFAHCRDIARETLELLNAEETCA